MTMDLLQSEIIRELQVTEDQSATAETKQDLMIASEDAPIVKLANSVLGLAIKQGASDIHIEPMEGDVTLRYRIDGVLQVVQRLPKRVQMGLISRLKILSKLDISEKRLPQDGRFAVTLEGKPIDFRVSTVPGKWGEKVVMRILDKSNTQLGLEKIISHAPTLALIRDIIQQPYGIIYVTGPTGSGKTTTLYSALAEINDPGVNISTAEDPIEYKPPRGHADPGEPGDQPDVRVDPARVSPAGSGRHAGWRNTRQGNGAHVGRGGADRASRVHDPAHQQRVDRVHASRGDGDRAVPGLVVHDRRDRAAARAAAVPDVQGACTTPTPRRRASSDCARGRGCIAPAAARPAAARVSRGASVSTK